MVKQPLVILGSARKQSDTLFYVDFVFKNTGVKVIDLLDFNIAAYNYKEHYPENDMFLELVSEMLNHETIIFATPVYWYSMSGLMKIFFDRLTDLVTTEKHSGRKLKGKSISLLAVGADEVLPDGFEIPFKSTADYFGMNYKACVYFSTDHPKQEKEKMRKAFIDCLNLDLPDRP